MPSTIAILDIYGGSDTVPSAFTCYQQSRSLLPHLLQNGSPPWVNYACLADTWTIEMNDYRLVAARQLVWKPDAWREPGLLALAILGLKGVIAEWPDDAQHHIEAKMLISKLYAATKKPIS